MMKKSLFKSVFFAVVLLAILLLASQSVNAWDGCGCDCSFHGCHECCWCCNPRGCGCRKCGCSCQKVDSCGGGGGDPCAGVQCPNLCEGDVFKSLGHCDGGNCKYDQSVTCTYGCDGTKCADPDNIKALCESKGFKWMPQGTDGGKCCGDDPSNSPATEPDSGRVLDSATQESKELLCTVPASGPVVIQSAGRRGEVVPIPGMASDALSSDRYWYVCDSSKDSDGKTPLDHKYDFWDGRRVDDTCRYVEGIGFYCGEIAGSDVVVAAASSGTPAGLISSTVDRSDDGKWYNYYGRLLGGANENIGSAARPLNVTLSGLDPAASYMVTIELANYAQGNNFYVRIGDSGAYTKLGERYNAWKALDVGIVGGVAETSVQFYYDGKTSTTIRMAVRNIRAVKVGTLYAEQRPVVGLDHDYICGTGMVFWGVPLAGERFIECCGSASECKTEHALHATGEVETGGTTWVCADDNRFYDKALVDSDPVVCELLGYVWSGDSCCGNDDAAEQEIWSWRGEQQGCCYASETQCLVDNAGSPNNNNLPETYFKTEKGPHCIASGQHVLNHYCDSGTWRSRNHGLADKLLKIVEDKDADNYVLFCDDYENALVYYEYITSMNNPLEDEFLTAESCHSGSKEYPCFNTFCVAAAPDKGFAVVGGSYNTPKNVSHVEELIGEEKGICGAPGPSDDYKDCGGSGLPGFKKANLWFSGKEQSFIYSTEKIGVGDGLWADIKSAFDTLISWVAGNTEYTFAEEVVEKADTYERFYILKSDGKSVFGREEGLYRDGVFDGVLALDFEGFTPELCSQLGERFTGSCTTTGDGTQYVAAARSDPEHVALFELWQYLTSALRLS